MPSGTCILTLQNTHLFNDCFLFFISLTRSGNRVIIMSIHQPRYSIYKQFDSLTLLSQGNMVYHGDIKETLQYFSGLGEEERERESLHLFLLIYFRIYL